LVDGRPELLHEIHSASAEIRAYISLEIALLLGDANFEYAVASQSLGSKDREELLFERLEELAKGHA
jgi:hypothetical protein